MSGVAWGVGRLVFGPGAVNLGPVFVFYVWMITLVMMAVAYLVSTRQQRIVTASAPVPQTPTVVPLALLSRLPVKYQSTPVLALQAEDHYVRVHTRDGSELILMRLSDAIAEMGTTPGARTHRSWWIAREAVKSVQRTDGRIVLELVSGIAVPVSRGYAAEIREAGWLGS
jgi:DNA-binding LytR/AlgR family response regulator